MKGVPKFRRNGGRRERKSDALELSRQIEIIAEIGSRKRLRDSEAHLSASMPMNT